MKDKKGLMNLYTSLAYKLVTCVVGLLIPRLFVMSYGSELNGLQSSITQIFAYIALIEAGVGEATIQSLFGPIARKDYRSANGILSATTVYYNKIGFIYFVILLLLAVLYPIIVEVSSVSYWTVFGYIIFAGATTGVNFFYQSKIILIMRAEGDMYYNSLFTMVAYLITSAIKIVFILAGYNIVLIQFSFFVINLLFIYGYYTVLKKKYSWVNFYETPNFKAVSQKSSVLVHKIAGLVFNSTDILLLTLICNLEVVSIYAMYKLVIGMVTTIIASFSDSFNYKLGQTYNNNTTEYYCKMIDVFNLGYSAFAFALFAITRVLIIPLLRLYTQGMDINYIFPLLPILYIVIEVLQVGREAMLRTITVAGHFQKTLYQAVIEMALNIIVTICAMLLCKYFWGVESCLYGALLGTIVALLYRTFVTNKYANVVLLKRSPWKTNKVMFVNILLYLVVYFIMNTFDWSFIDNYWSLIITTLIVSIIVLVIIIVPQVFVNRNEAQYLLRVIRKR